MKITKAINFTLEESEIGSLMKAEVVLTKIRGIMEDENSKKIFFDGQLDSTYDEIENTLKTIRKFICDKAFEVFPTGQES